MTGKRRPLKFVQVYTTRHGKSVTYYRRGNGPRFRLPDDMSSPEFQLAYEAAASSREYNHVRHMAVRPIEARKQKTEKTVRRALDHARARAVKKGLPFNLTLDWLLSQLDAQECRCALTGIEFHAEHEVAARVHPFTPSLDRISPSQGYTTENVRIVIFALNAMLLDWGEEIFELVANSYRYQKHKRRRFIPVPFQPSSRTLPEIATKSMGEKANGGQ